jgi:hypothetical protein
MRRLITLLLAAAATTAVVRAIARKRASGAEESPGPSVMPRPTAAPAGEKREEPVHETDEPSADESGTSETPGPIPEGESGAITAAPVPEEPVPEPPPAPDDSELERAVESEIAEDPAVETESVEVDVEGGVAQLRGSVPDEPTALRVGDDAARVDGVIGLDDQLERTGTPAGEDATAHDDATTEADEPDESRREPGPDPGATRRSVDAPE